MVKRFAIYGILGWSMEVLWTGMGAFLLGDWRLPGFTFLWMFPIYGLAVLMEPLHDQISSRPWYVRGLIWMAVIFGLEYFSGWALAAVLGRCPWDYSSVTPYHIRGLIRLDYAPAWFAVGLLFERLHHTLDEIRV